MSTESKLEVQGIVQRHPIPELLVEINQVGLEGSLRLSNKDHKAVVYFDRGNIAFAVSNAREHRLFSILLEQERISESDLAGIEDYTNDFRLAAALTRNGVLTREEADEYFRFQIDSIVNTATGWTSGNWVFTPLARLKEELRHEVDLRAALFRFSKSMTDFEILARFKSYEESFALNPGAKESRIEFSPQEAFVLSRIDANPLSIEQLQAVCGLEGNELMPILYRLWLGGFIIRDRWNKAFGKEMLERIERTKVTLKRSALSVEEEERRKEEEARKAAEEEERLQKEEEERQKRAEEKRAREQFNRDADYTEIEMSIDDYLDLVESAPTYYDIFGIKPDAKAATVKRAYFSYARRFHPDIFHKSVDEEKHKKIQKAFTEIAQAYETLRSEDTRELYDLKMSKVLEAIREREGEDLSGLTREEFEQQTRSGAALESFRRGRQLLDDGRHEEAAQHLGRAIQLEPESAEFRAYFGLALSKEKKNRHKAESELRKAVELDPSETRFRLMLARLYVEIGLSVRATNELKKLLEIDPGHPEAGDLLKSIGSGR